MADRMHRTQILLEPRQHRALAALARSEGASLSEVLRRIVDRELERRDRARDAEIRQRLEALEVIEGHCREALARRDGKPLEVDVAGLLQSMREERDEENLGRAFGRGD